MPAEIIPVGVVVERRSSASKWAGFSWRVTGVLSDMPDQAAWSELRRDGESIVYFAGIAELELHPSDTPNYRDNLLSGGPLLWAVLRPCEQHPGLELAVVTADPGEGEALTAAGDLVVEAVPMPADIAHRLRAFVERHPLERPFVKRARE